MNDECEGGDRGGLLVVGAEFPTWPTYNLEGISDELFGDILSELNIYDLVYKHYKVEHRVLSDNNTLCSSVKITWFSERNTVN